ncbi:DUF350 domain-containing protein [Streptomonospora salina]|uniref:Uncharacterized membrane protein YjfL (UPF0719 family) n=1 Tax=Streptomonospora salina TaxID=104205 RepID=A0A841EEH8_9ACTN|nr:DUF350 domain-containing protein [Streptomonospora salina]MBB5999453.1 uncharacterized membrane protein YjfL (UPF0719 family) [Streptomonospora salina]
MSVLLYESGASLAYGVLGIVLMVLGYLIVDVLTPGKLHELVWVQRNRNAALLVASNLLGVAVVVATAIYISTGALAIGLASAAAYGIVGLVLMALSFVLIDMLTPGKLGEVLTSSESHPAVWVNASAHLAIALMVAAAIS